MNKEINIYTAKTVNSVSKGEKLTKATTLENLAILAMGKPKGSLPALFATEKRSDWTKSNCCFIDIDSTEGVEEIIERRDEIFMSCPYVYAFQKSFSGKLHVICYMDETDDAKKWIENTTKYTFKFVEVVKSITGIDYLNIDKAVDTHSINPAQALYVSQYPFHYNDNCKSVDLSGYCIKEIVRKNKVSTFSSMRKNVANTNVSTQGTYNLNKNFYCAGYSGYELRFRYAANVLIYFKNDYFKALDFIARHASPYKEIKSCLDTFANKNSHYIYYNPIITRTLIENQVTLDPDKYISDYINIPADRYSYIIANPGTGKTNWANNYLKNNEKTCLIQFNYAIRDGKVTLNIDDYFVSKKDSLRVYDNINNVCKLDIDWENWTVIVDEAHFMTEYISIKQYQIDALLRILNRAKKVVFMSGTPQIEKNLFDFKEYIFIKKKDCQLNIIDVTYDDKKQIVDTLKDKGGILFSNKNYDKFEDLLEDTEYTRFRSDERPINGVAKTANQKKMLSILKDNNMVDNIVLATKYLGVGVEIKGKESINLFFDLAEGFNTDFILQAIGRPRDAKEINVYLFHKEDTKYGYSITQDLQNIISYAKDSDNRYNLLAERELCIDLRDSSEKIFELAKANKILCNKRCCSSDVFHACGVYYPSMNYTEINLTEDTEKHTRKYDTSDPELMRWILSSEGWNKVFSQTYSRCNNDIIDSAPYKNKTRAMTTIRTLHSLYKWCYYNDEIMRNIISFCNNDYKLLREFKNLIDARDLAIKAKNPMFVIVECKEAESLKSLISKAEQFFSDSYMYSNDTVDKELNEIFDGFLVRRLKFNNMEEFHNSLKKKNMSKRRQTSIVYEGVEYESVKDLKDFLRKTMSKHKAEEVVKSLKESKSE